MSLPPNAQASFLPPAVIATRPVRSADGPVWCLKTTRQVEAGLFLVTTTRSPGLLVSETGLLAPSPE